MTDIGNSAFCYCHELLDVYCYAENVPNTVSTAFPSSSIADITLHVPAASIDSYRATEPWSGFGKIIPLSGTIPPSNLTLTDGEEYENNIEQEVGTLTYTRTLPTCYGIPCMYLSRYLMRICGRTMRWRISMLCIPTTTTTMAR